MPYPKITRVHLHVTHRCNLACKYCYVKQSPLDMSIEVAKKSIDFLAENAAKSGVSPTVCFFGGEPLLLWDDIVCKTIQYAKESYPQAKFGFSITTNGTLLTDDKLEYCKKNHIKLLVSSDGCEKTQNSNRPFHDGKGTFDIVDKALKKAIELRLSNKFRTTLYPQTVGNLCENYLYAVELKIPIFAAIIDAFSEWDIDAEKLLYRELNKIADHYVAYQKTHGKPPINFETIGRQLSYVKQGISFSKTVPLNQKVKCGLGQTNQAAISPTGGIYACHEMTSNDGEESVFYIGDVFSGVNEKKRNDLSKLLRTETKSGDMNCKRCIALGVCNGGCVASNYLINKNINCCPHAYCLYQRALYKTASKVNYFLGKRDSNDTT